AVSRAILLVEVLSLHSVGIPFERERPIAQVRQQGRRDAQVVVDHLRLGEAGPWVEDLGEIGELEPLSLDDDLLRGGHPLFLFFAAAAFRGGCARALLAARCSVPARCRISPRSRPSSAAAACGFFPPFAAARLFCSASMRLTTLPRGSSAGASATISSPSALRSSSASTCSRYCSLYLRTSTSAPRDSISCSAIFTSRSPRLPCASRRLSCSPW